MYTILSQDVPTTPEVRVARSSPVASDRLLGRPAESSDEDTGTAVTSVGRRIIDRIKLGILPASPAEHESDSTKELASTSYQPETEIPKIITSTLQVQLAANVQEEADSYAGPHLDILA